MRINQVTRDYGNRFRPVEVPPQTTYHLSPRNSGLQLTARFGAIEVDWPETYGSWKSHRLLLICIDVTFPNFGYIN